MGFLEVREDERKLLEQLGRRDRSKLLLLIF
jgi:hypothetical protein